MSPSTEDAVLAVLSPAKSLDFETPPHVPVHSAPELIDHTLELLETARALPPAELKRLMHISDDLAELNHARFQSFDWPFSPKNAKPAALAFTGDTYRGFDAPTLDTAALNHAQEHVAILSGFYGVLRPMDLIQAYRLEMGTKLGNPRGRSLVVFWRETITAHLRQRLAGHADKTLVNLASNEYFAAVRLRDLGADRVITPVFQDVKAGKTRVVSFFAKRARGMMARFIAQERLSEPSSLSRFTLGGYALVEDDSTVERPVYRRIQPPPPGR